MLEEGLTWRGLYSPSEALLPVSLPGFYTECSLGSFIYLVFLVFCF